MKNKRIIYLILSIFLIMPFSSQAIRFVNAIDYIRHYKLSQYKSLSLEECLYLDTLLASEINKAASNYLTKNKIKIKEFNDYIDIKRLRLSKNYKSLKDVLDVYDPSLNECLGESSKMNINNPILFYRQKAFVRYETEDSSRGFVMRLCKPNVLELKWLWSNDDDIIIPTETSK